MARRVHVAIDIRVDVKSKRIVRGDVDGDAPVDAFLARSHASRQLEMHDSRLPRIHMSQRLFN